jgi:predicted ATPase
MQRADAAGAGVRVEQVRDALAHLYDPGHLQTHPLAALLGGTERTSRGRALRQTLLDAVAALRPVPDGRPGPKALRRHQILTRRYLDGLAPASVQAELLVGRSEYYREHQQALEAVASVLRERLGAAEPGTGPGATTRPSAPAAGLSRRLPVYLTSFVGRDAEVADLARRLSTSRLLTLTGAGGCGKTRLAVHVAAAAAGAYPAGVWFVDLAPLEDERLVPSVALTALGEAEDPGRDHQAVLLAHLARRELLLVLDNCEHVVDAAARLASEVVAACPGVQVVATSREPLAVPGEAIYRVPPLAAPESVLPLDGATPAPVSAEDVAGFPAVQLFVERGRAAEASFALTAGNAAAVAQICRRLDGMPLAIELAAARLRAMTPAEIAERLDDRFRLLTAGSRVAVPRQQTLEALIDWSHELLSETERRLFRRLSVFSGGWGRDAARAICAIDGDLAAAAIDDTLARLVDRSLVVASTDGATTRFHMLETIRAYAAERLDAAGEGTLVRAAALSWCVELAARAEGELSGPNQTAWLDRLEAEIGNWRVALDWAREHDPSAGLRLATMLGRLWNYRLHWTEGIGWIETFLELNPAETVERGYALLATALLHNEMGDGQTGRRCLEDALEIFDAHGEHMGAGWALENLASVERNVFGDVARGRRRVEAAVARSRASGVPWRLGWSVLHLGNQRGAEGDFHGAIESFSEALTHFETAGDVSGVCSAHRRIGIARRQAGDSVGAVADLARALAIASQHHLRAEIADLTIDLGLAHWELGDDAEAERLVREWVDRVGAARPQWRGETLTQLGAIYRRRRDWGLARAALSQGLAASQERAMPLHVARALRGLGNLARSQGQSAQAAIQYDRSLVASAANEHVVAQTLLMVACLADSAGASDQARQLIAAVGAAHPEARRQLLLDEREDLERVEANVGASSAPTLPVAWSTLVAETSRWLQRVAVGADDRGDRSRPADR